MLRGAQFPQEYKQQIKAAGELGDIFDVFEQHKLYCNWLNVRLLKRIAKNLDNRRAVKLIQFMKKMFIIERSLMSNGIFQSALMKQLCH